jgi:hypothetical protein
MAEGEGFEPSEHTLHMVGIRQPGFKQLLTPCALMRGFDSVMHERSPGTADAHTAITYYPSSGSPVNKTWTGRYCSIEPMGHNRTQSRWFDPGGPHFNLLETKYLGELQLRQVDLSSSRRE